MLLKSGNHDSLERTAAAGSGAAAAAEARAAAEEAAARRARPPPPRGAFCYLLKPPASPLLRADRNMAVHSWLSNGGP